MGGLNKMYQEVMRRIVRFGDEPFEMVIKIDLGTDECTTEARCNFYSIDKELSFNQEYDTKYDRIYVSEAEIADRFYKWMRSDFEQFQKERLWKKNTLDCITKDLLLWEPSEI